MLPGWRAIGQMRTTARAMAVLVHAVLLVGCAPPKAHTTFLRSVDLIEMTDQMATSFASDEIIGSRTPGDEPWIVSIRQIENHTNQIIPNREKWLYVARLRAQLAQARLSEQHNLIWIIPPERWAEVSEEIREPNEPEHLRMDPTHLLTAEFHTLTTTSGRGRSDAYLCDYQLIDLQTARVIWEDKWEVKRVAVGRTYD